MSNKETIKKEMPKKEIIKDKNIYYKNRKEQEYRDKHNIKGIVKCKFCEENLVNFSTSKNRYVDCCSNTCSMYYKDIKLSKKELIKKTSFLDKGINKRNISIKERRYCINNNITEIPICQYCKKNPVGFINFYFKTCSSKCSMCYKNSGGLSKPEILEITKFLDIKAGIPERLYCIRNDIKSIVKCKFCGENNVRFNRGKYNDFCSKECSLYFKKVGLNKSSILKKTKDLEKRRTIKERVFFLSKGLVYEKHCPKCKESLDIDFKHLSFVCKNKCGNSSIKEKEIVDFIKKIYNGKIIENDRNILDGKELDIFLPDIGLAIEYNGLMFHSVGKDKSSKFDNYLMENKIKYNHYKKTEVCKNKGIKLFYIFENEWLDNNKRKIWKNILKKYCLHK